MPAMNRATRAYAAAAARRSLREQEADLFWRTNEALRLGRDAGGLAKVRALVDNQRLWSAVIDLLRDPDNALPVALRATMISVGLTVQREMQATAPDIAFLIAINENIASGLRATP
jgi:flagellar biosynthesis activator protein FlaF